MFMKSPESYISSQNSVLNNVSKQIGTIEEDVAISFKPLFESDRAKWSEVTQLASSMWVKLAQLDKDTRDSVKLGLVGLWTNWEKKQAWIEAKAMWIYTEILTSAVNDEKFEKVA